MKVRFSSNLLQLLWRTIFIVDYVWKSMIAVLRHTYCIIWNVWKVAWNTFFKLCISYSICLFEMHFAITKNRAKIGNFLDMSIMEALICANIQHSFLYWSWYRIEQLFTWCTIFVNSRIASIVHNIQNNLIIYNFLSQYFYPTA